VEKLHLNLTGANPTSERIMYHKRRILKEFIEVKEFDLFL